MLISIVTLHALPLQALLLRTLFQIYPVPNLQQADMGGWNSARAGGGVGFEDHLDCPFAANSTACNMYIMVS